MNMLQKYYLRWLKYIFCFVCFLYSEVGICIDSSGAWIDIPTASFVDSSVNKHNLLASLINQYHAINKMELDLLSKRIDSLKRIHLAVLQAVENKSDHQSSKLLRFDALVKKKSWYLSKLLELYNEPYPYHAFLNAKSKEEPYTPLILVNKVLFDFKLPIYWGLYWLEALDPCHRFLTGHYLKWKESESSIPFFLWLEDQEIPYNAIQVKYFSEEEIQTHQITILNGLFVNKLNLSPVTFENHNKEYLFAMTLDKKLIVVEGSEKVRHTSITHGKPVLGSGSIKIQKGKLTYIDAESGHYQPSLAALRQIIEILKKQGANLDYANIKVKYYKEGEVISESALSFFRKYKNETSSLKSNEENLQFRI